jgi:hypothetical protein
MRRAADPALTRGLAEIVAERWLAEHGTTDPGLFVDFCTEAMRVAIARRDADT